MKQLEHYSLQELCYELHEAKKLSDIARERVKQINGHIQTKMPVLLDSQETKNFGCYRVSVRRPVKWTVKNSILEEVFKFANPWPVRFKVELDVKAYKVFEKDNPEAFQFLSKYVECKPASTTVTLKLVGKE